MVCQLCRSFRCVPELLSAISQTTLMQGRFECNHILASRRSPGGRGRRRCCRTASPCTFSPLMRLSAGGDDATLCILATKGPGGSGGMSDGFAHASGVHERVWASAAPAAIRGTGYLHGLGLFNPARGLCGWRRMNELLRHVCHKFSAETHQRWRNAPRIRLGQRRSRRPDDSPGPCAAVVAEWLGLGRPAPLHAEGSDRARAGCRRSDRRPSPSRPAVYLSHPTDRA